MSDKQLKISYKPTGTFKERLTNAPAKQWLKFAIAALLVLFCAVSMGQFWLVLLILWFGDIYITRFVNWSGWKECENPVLRTIASWVDAIIFALVAVYFINLYFFQNYKIPSSSMEKSLLVGDYLFVSKLSYGPRSPMTPLSFPLAQHTMPVFGCKSYLDFPKWDYKRLKGLGEVERYDVVVFNFPAGDTVCRNYEAPDYYSICNQIGESQIQNQIQDNPQLAAHIKAMTYRQRKNYANAIGRTYVHADKKYFGDILVRPVDRRENYVKRCVGLPGETLQIKNGDLFINGEQIANPKNTQFNYWVWTTATLSDKFMNKLGISKADRQLVSPIENTPVVTETHSASDLIKNAGLPSEILYHFPLTQSMKEELEKDGSVVKIALDTTLEGTLFPMMADTKWTRDNYGPIYIPKKGEKVELNASNIALYERAIAVYEGNDLKVVNDSTFVINGEPASSYTFKMDYYWMMGDNRHNSADSRYWGFVPEDHIVGKPLFVWASVDNDALNGSTFRWNRFFMGVGNE